MVCARGSSTCLSVCLSDEVLASVAIQQSGAIVMPLTLLLTHRVLQRDHWQCVVLRTMFD
jgi:hypothetical protein